MKYTFYNRLLSKIVASTSNNYTDNNESAIPGERVIGENLSFRNYLKQKFIYTRLVPKIEVLNNIDKTWNFLSIYGENINYLYEKLENEESKKLLVDIIAYRLLGHTKVKFETNTDKYWKLCNETKKYIDINDYISIYFLNWKLYKTSYQLFNIPISIYTIPSTMVTYEFLNQYSYTYNSVDVKVEKDDIVIDCGGCFGDTAILFGYKTGENGKVYSFEFIPSNISIFKRNLDLNPTIKNITIIPYPLWDKKDVVLYYNDNGPGSKVNNEKYLNYDGEIKTTTIDDYFQNENFTKIDFIKMDIEGAELNALKGAIQTIKTHKPKLAISIYHSLDDFYSIPHFISNLNLGYKFYIGHHTLNIFETVLYAKVD